MSFRDCIKKRTIERDGFTVIVMHVMDTDPDTSYLKQDYREESPKDRALYLAQDKARLKGLERGDWYYMGVAVEVRRQTAANWANGGLEVGRASIWGIESDSDGEYIKTTEREMIQEAMMEVEHLQAVLCGAQIPAIQDIELGAR